MTVKVLMVCLGNICRSPLAEGILKSKLDPKTFLVDSAGTKDYHIGSKPDERSIAVARKYGLDISHQRCRKFKAQDFKDFDLIYVMDKRNYDDVMALSPNLSDKNKVKFLLSENNSNGNEVPDPYYGGNNGFESVYNLIDDACERIASELNAR